MAKRMKKFQALLLLPLLFPLTLHASFIEATMGTAVVNDATAVYYNPAALALLKNPQIIALNSFARFRSQFTGQASRIGFAQSGSTITQTNYYLPSFYLGVPITDKITTGLAVVSNFFNKDVDGNSLLRYVQSNNNIKDVDLVPALEYKLTDFFSLGAGMNLSYANFLFTPTSGFPGLNIPDSQSRNECDGTGVGWDAGFLLRPSKATLIGFNYRSSITYRLSGESVFEGNPKVVSNDYGFTFWTPARFVLSANQFITPKLGFIGTVQRVEWSIIQDVNIHGIATQIGPRPVILNAKVPYHLHDTWMFTLGSHYRITPKWIIRIAGNYNQSPGNSNFQIVNGDSITVGTSTGYEITKNIVIDGGYAHTFIQDKNIHVTTGINRINGVTNGSVNAFSLKVTFNFV